MGAYLSEPVKEKHSIDEANEFLQVGASSMQGWRISQEDAHNCILKLNENTSYFAVYDGHGGAEVAKYCSEKLPDFLKNLQSFQDGNFEEALKQAFLKFDGTLLEESVIEELKKIAGERNPAESNSDVVDDEEEEEDLAQLCQESALPLEKVLAKYKAKKAATQADKIKEEEIEAGSSGTSKPLSPRLRGRRNTEKNSENEPASSSASSSGAGTSSSSAHLSESNDDSQVSSSEAKCVSDKNEGQQNKLKSSEAVSASDQASKTNGENKIKQSTPSASSSSSVKNSTAPDSSISNSIKTDKVQNGDIKAETSSGVSSSSTSNNENGEKTIIPPNKENSDLDADDNDYEYSEDDEDDDDDDDDEEEEEESERSYEEFDDGEEGDEWMYKDTYGDEKFCANMIEEPGKDSGCTAVVAVLNGRDLYVANAGDSRCVVCRGGKAIDMSIDHKPEDVSELKRIVKAGGHVTLDGRVNGGLNLSRAIGDHAYKMNAELPPEEQMISALPDVKKLILEPNDEFMILACDGIWNYMSSEEVVELVKEFIDEDFEEMSAICEELLSTCLAPSTLGDGTGCDNMTAIIIRFKPTIFELPTKLNPDETIINEEKKVSDATIAKTSESETETETTATVSDEIIKPKAKKRAVSPTTSDNNSDLTSTTEVVNKPEDEQSTKRFKKENDTPSSSSSTSSEAVAVICDKSATFANEIETEDTEKENQSQMDTDAAEADAAAASITTTTSET